MTEPRQKLLIGVPAFNGIVAESQESFMRMIYCCGRDLPWLDVAVEIITKREQWRARNRLVDAAIASGFDWLLMVDDDHIYPPNLVARLLAHNKEVCGALYHQRGGQYHPVIMKRSDHPDGSMSVQFLRHTDPMLTTPGLYTVDVAGGGCLLFKTDIFRKLMPPYFTWERTLGTDVSICTRLADAGVEVWCDTSIELGHVRDAREIITSRTIPLAERELASIAQQLWDDALSYTTMHPDELESAMVQASRREQRQEKWHSGDRRTWPGVRAYYQDFGNWHLYNLLSFNLHHHEVTKQWAVLKSGEVMGPAAQVIDFGCGLGHITIPLAQQGHCVHAIDIQGAPTLDFLRYRLGKHRIETVTVHETPDPIPDFTLRETCDGAFAISMIEHTWDPWGCLVWLHAHVRPGGFLVCDYACDLMPEEPQHLRRYEPTTFARDMGKIGWMESPEFRWMFIRL